MVNDRVTEYKGEEFEHVLISAYLAMNFAFLGKDDDAIVECRRVNRKLERLRTEGKRNYELNAFAQYLSGILFEKDRNWNNAYIDFKKTYEIQSAFSRLRKELVRGAIEMDHTADLNKWRKTLSITDEEIKTAKKEIHQLGSVVLLYQNGFAPEKFPNSTWPELPEYRSRYNKHRAAHLYLNGQLAARSEILFDVEKAAKENLKEKFATYVAKRAAGVIVREVVGDVVAKQTKNEGLGFLVKVAMAAASQADLRAWLTLPQNFQVARADIVPGKYHATLKLENIYGAEEGERDLGEIEIRRPGDIVLLNWRSLND